MEQLIIGNLWPREQELFKEILYNREGALAWEFSEIRRVSLEVTPPQKIRTVPHKAWQEKSFPIPKALQGTVIQMLKDRIKKKLLEPYQSPYRNPWFLVKKKDKNYRLINTVIRINKVTI